MFLFSFCFVFCFNVLLTRYEICGQVSNVAFHRFNNEFAFKKKKTRKPYVTRVNYITAAIQKKTVHYLIIDCIGVIFDKKKDVTV